MSVNWVIGTAINSKFFIQAQQMLYSIQGHLPIGTTVLVLDNGMTDKQRTILVNHFGFVKFIFLKKDLSIYERQSYYFKAIIHKIALEQYKDCVYIWLDTKTTLKFDENKLLGLLAQQPVYSHVAFPQPERIWTDERTLDLMEITKEDRETGQFQASAMLFDLRNPTAVKFLDELIRLNDNKDILSPEGSVKGSHPPTHRQDQSIFSCLLKKYKFIKNDYIWAICHQTLFL